MAYLPIALNHFRALAQCAEAAGLKMTLDCASFCLEVKGRGRYFTLYPQFMARMNGRMVYTPQLNDNNVGFTGWLPYRPVFWDGMCDKLRFKRFMDQHGRRTPRTMPHHAVADSPFLIKHSAGSFGQALEGPYPAGQLIDIGTLPLQGLPPRGEAFAEAFIHGTPLKVWLWGDSPFFAHHPECPRIVGTGHRTVGELVQERLARVGQAFDGEGDQRSIALSLALQGVERATVLPDQRALWIDYRYGRSYAPVAASNVSDSDWPSLADGIRAEAMEMARLVGGTLETHFGAPILCSVDAVVDASGTVWWLEANTNPMVPPEAYRLVFETLFGPAPAATQPLTQPDAVDAFATTH